MAPSEPEQPVSDRSDQGPVNPPGSRFAEADASPAAARRTSRRRRRRRLAVAVLAAVLIVGAPAYYYAFNNVPLHGEAWLAANMDGSIRRGLDYLYTRGTFGMKMEEGGEPRVHHYFLEKILQLEDDPRLREHMARAQLLNEDHWEWRTWAGLPGWRRPSFSPEDRRKIMKAVADSSPESNPRAYYCQWLAYAIYPQWTSLSTREKERLFYNTQNLDSSYHLTHALLSYCWLKHSDPTLARTLEVDRLIAEVNARLTRHQTWDARTADIYNERVAFWLHLDNGPPINRRWIERIILSQNPDGGWPFDPKLARLLQQMVGLSGHDDLSDPHATFLGVYALLKYRELMRQRGTYPPG